MKTQRGFTFVEVIVVIAIISILAGAVIFNAVRANTRSRDIDRQADLRTLQSAIELYKQRYGRYPDGCNGPGNWSGQADTNHRCNGNSGIYAAYAGTGQYIIGHQAGISFAPEFIPALPQDKRLAATNPGDSGYVYTVNTAGTVYKLEARRTVEDDTVTYSHPLKSCDANNSSRDLSSLQYYSDAPLCNYVYASNGKPAHCLENDSTQTFQKTYGVWGGNSNGPTPTSQAEIVNSAAVLTQQVVCK
jgi:prepilin-type N-terminal cleavage/methylation domain-containing protein